MRTIVTNATVLDTGTMTYTPDQTVVIEDGRFVDVDCAASRSDADVSIDAAGKYVVPGMIDAHVHMRLATLDFRAIATWTEVEFGIIMAGLAADTVERGFTTVRDLGGELRGLQRAISRGIATGPRIVKAGRMISQTGGHGDTGSHGHDVPECACTIQSDWAGIIADGPDAVTKAARYLLKEGSDFLKIHVSGGVATPSDPLDSVQYTPAEVRAAVTEAEHRNTYVAAHAYIPEAIQMAVSEGVFTIEHGNLIDAPSAALMVEKGSVLVPTLVTYKAMHDFGQRLGLPPKNMEKNAIVYDAGLASLEIAVEAGVTMGLGTDLIGEAQRMQNEELIIRSEVQPAADVLRSMWQVNARLCHLEGEIGVIAPGAHGDLLVSNVDPLEDLARFADHERALTHVVQGGRVMVERTA